MKNFIFLVLLFISIPMFGQFDFDLAGGSNHVSIGRASVSSSGSDAIFNNPAGLTNISGLILNINALRRYNIAGLDYYSGGISYCSSNNAFSFRLLQKGLNEYKESSIGFSYARKLSQSFSIGSSFNYNFLSQSEFNNKGYLTLDIGLLSNVSDKVIIGVKIKNPTNRKIDDFNKISSGIRLGLKYIVSGELKVFNEIQKNIGFDPEIKAGLDYAVVDNFNVLIGVIPTNSEFTFGIKYNFNKTLQLSSAFLYDQRIDITPVIGISYFQTKE